MKRKSFIYFLIIEISIMGLLLSSCEKTDDTSLSSSILEEKYVYKEVEYTCKYKVINDSILQDYSKEYSTANRFIEGIQNMPNSGVLTLSNCDLKYLFDSEVEADEYLRKFGNPVPKSNLKAGGAPTGSFLRCYEHSYHNAMMFDCFANDIYPQPNYYATEQYWGFSNMDIYYKGWNDKMSSIHIKNTHSILYLEVRIYEHHTFGGSWVIFIISNNSDSNAGVVNYSPDANTANFLYTNTAQTKDFSLRRLKTVRDGWFSTKVISWNDQVSSIKWKWFEPVAGKNK